MSSHTPSSAPDQQVTLEARGPGEWIVAAPAGGRALHVYRLAPADWLVSVVGRDSEGRGADLKQALAALSTGVPRDPWWDLAAEMLDGVARP
jgi:sarcosine oxidase gamma subunit